MEQKLPKYSRENFIKACGNNDINFVKHATENIIKRVPLDFALAAIKAARDNGHMEIIKYLFEEPNTDKFFSKHISNVFTYECIDGHLNLIKYLIKDHLLKINQKDKNGRTNYSTIHIGAYYAARSGNVQILDYLFNSNLSELSPDSLKDGVLLSYCCTKPGLNSLKYLYSKSQLKDNIDIHFDNDLAFKKIYDCHDLDYIKYLVFDLNINKTQEITNYLAKYNNEHSKEINKLFDIRDFTESLNAELSNNENNSNSKRLKV